MMIELCFQILRRVSDVRFRLLSNCFRSKALNQVNLKHCAIYVQTKFCRADLRSSAINNSRKVYTCHSSMQKEAGSKNVLSHIDDMSR